MEGQRKFWRKLWLEGLHGERERREEKKKLKMEGKLWKNLSVNLSVLTTEELTSLNSWKMNLKQYKTVDKVLYVFLLWLWIITSYEWIVNSRSEQ